MRYIGFTVLLSLWWAASTFAAPIYVYKEKSGVIHFTSRPPPDGVKAQVFTGRSSNVSFVRWSRPYHGGRLMSDRYAEIIERAAGEHKVDPALVRAVIHVESLFNPRAVSPKGARGLMQLMPGTAKLYGVTKVFEPDENIKAGTRHLAMLLNRYHGNLANALAAYNAGEEAVNQYNGIPPYAETREYVRRVQLMHTRYSQKDKQRSGTF